MWMLAALHLKSNFADLQTEVDKLAPVPNDLAKLSNVVKNSEYNKLVTKVDNIDATNFA